MSDNATGGKQRFVVYLDGESHWIGTHGGPYAPVKARELRGSMESHIARGNYRDWSIPEDAEKVEAVTREELRELKETSLRTDGGTGGSERECHIGSCGNKATREVWNTRGEKWLPVCDEGHFPMYSDRNRVRSLDTDRARCTEGEDRRTEGGQ